MSNPPTTLGKGVPVEVNAIEYIRLLAVDEDIDPDIQAKYSAMLDELLPGWEDMGEGEEYMWPSKGYNVPWSCLTQREQEACEVYMLGRVLWCIFEASSAPQRAAVWLSYRWEPLVEFPGYTTTPQPIRDLIDRCTRGRQPGLTKYIVRERDRLVMRELDETKVPAELHFYDGVPHGFGLRASNTGPVANWPAQFVDWLRQRKII